MARIPRKRQPKSVEALTHEDASRKNIPTVEYQSVMRREDRSPVRKAYERRNRDLDPQLVWRGKDEQDLDDLVVNAPPLYIQEKVHPKVLIDDLLRRSQADQQADESQVDLFADFNGLPDENAKTEFYRHDANWSNRMILGDSLQVMASLAEREGLRGKVQCIYIDPPYGIKFNSNFQWSTTSRDVKDGKKDHITREPEQVKAFRDTWKDGIHSYLTYLRDRLTVARELLTESGSVFVQIGDENVHRVRAVMDEVLGVSNFVSQIIFLKNSGATDALLASPSDTLLWYSKSLNRPKFRRMYHAKLPGGEFGRRYNRIQFEDGTSRRATLSELSDPSSAPIGSRFYTEQPAISQGYRKNTSVPFVYNNRCYDIGTQRNWKTHLAGMERLSRSGRLIGLPKMIYFKRFIDDFPSHAVTNIWSDTQDRLRKTYVVETVPMVIERCILMTTDPGDLVLDPTCGSGTTAYVAEQCGRRWITIDTSRVALALARARIMGARYPYYVLADSRDGQLKEGELTRKAPSDAPTYGDIRQGFVYQRVPHITLKSIANNAEIDVIYEQRQPAVVDALALLNGELQASPPGVPNFMVSTGGRKGERIDFSAPDGQSVTLPSGESAPANALLEWEVPRDPPEGWSKSAKEALERFWEARIARQKEIDASIAANAKFEYLYDKPYEDRKKVRVAGPFTVESLSPHRELPVDENDNVVTGVTDVTADYDVQTDFAELILDNLQAAGVQQAHKEDKIEFRALTPWPGHLICAEGRYQEGGSGQEKRGAIFIGPEFGTVTRADLAEAAREAGESGFDVLIACAFSYEARASEFDRLGRIPVLRARMNADLHMADDLKNTGKGNLFVIFGEPDIDILDAADDQVQVKINGVDVFHPQSGEIRSHGPEGIACWFIDTDYNAESFFVRHAYFLGANDPYKSLKTTLKAEINAEAWATLRSDTSRPFPKPTTGRIAVKVINHLGDEVIKVFRL